MSKDGSPLKRPGKVPCEASIGCPKGHWANPKHRALTAAEESLVRLYHASVASGGAMLNEHERSDSVLAVLFSRLSIVFQAKHTSELATAVAARMQGAK